MEDNFVGIFVNILRKNNLTLPWDTGRVIAYDNDPYDCEMIEEGRFYIIECFDGAANTEIARFSRDEFEASESQDWGFCE